MKICCKCKKELDESMFYVKRKGKCKECIKIRQDIYNLKNKDKINKNRKLYYNKNKDKINKKHGIYLKQYNKDNSDKNKEYQKQYYINNKPKINKRHKEYRLKNKDKINIKIKNWMSNNEKYKEHRRLYSLNRTHTDINFRILQNLRHRIKEALKNNFKSAHTLELLGCSIDHLKQHLQQTTINNGYIDFDINNYSGHQYHIDHIMPCSKFNLKCSFHQKLCFNWSNMQILSAKDNIKKHTSIPAELVI
jgi:hypothetical protein